MNKLSELIKIVLELETKGTAYQCAECNTNWVAAGIYKAALPKLAKVCEVMRKRMICYCEKEFPCGVCGALAEIESILNE